METTHKTGEPVLRPMFYDFPKDANTWELKDQYMFGPDILVAPVVEPDVPTRTVYLPEGNWKHLFTGEEFTGGCSYTISTPKEEIPVFLRNGSHAEWIDAIKNL